MVILGKPEPKNIPIKKIISPIKVINKRECTVPEVSLTSFL